MEMEMRAGCQIPEKTELCNVFARMGHMLRHAVSVIASCREAQARRRIQLFFDDRLLKELEEAGLKVLKKIADE